MQKPFPSNAQNFEDITLWKSLKTIEKGFYIDVGANNPNFDSVTKTFYDKGWRGINIEPTTQWFNELMIHRPEDINLRVAAGESPGEQIIYEIPDSGLSTSSKVIAERHKSHNNVVVNRINVEVKTLEQICIESKVSDIHFLKIDVEGAEKEVVNGTNLNIVRPWIILIESVTPFTHQQNHTEWESILLTNGYKFVLFDGLNRFYVAKERPEIIEGFNTPPNIFDGFIFTGNGSSSFQNNVAILKDLNKNVRAKLHACKRDIEKLESEREFKSINRYEVTISKKDKEINDLKIEIKDLNKWSHHWWTTAENLKKKLEKVELHSNSLNASSHHWWITSENYKKRISELENSLSWRVTLPLRLALNATTYLSKKPFLWTKYIVRRIIEWILKRDKLANRINSLLLKWPWLHQKIIDFYTAAEHQKRDAVASLQDSLHTQNVKPDNAINDQLSIGLTSRAVWIKDQLKELIEKKIK